MTNYKMGKIYEIICNTTGERYIGSTTRTLARRLTYHTSQKSKHLSKPIIERKNYFINLLENYPCNTNKELQKREDEWRNSLDCINKETKQQHTRAEYYKKYFEKYAEQRKEYMREYHKKNADREKIQQKEYNKLRRKANSKNNNITV